MSECPKDCTANCAECASAPVDPWLQKLDARVAELHGQKHYGCSMTVLKIGMERLGMDDPDLIRAMEGFCGGGCGGVCGALAGGCALLGLYMGKGTDDEPRSQALANFREQLTETFRAYWKSDQCEELVHDDPAQKKDTCSSLMAGTVEMVWGILHENGIDLDSRKIDRTPKK